MRSRNDKSKRPSKHEPANANRPRSRSAASTVFQFKITLLETKPPVWRRIQVEDCTLDKLHEHIQTAMGWTNSHLHRFVINGIIHGDPELLYDGWVDEERPINSRRLKIGKIVPKSGQRLKFKYEYDFGDGWQHEILFEGRPTKAAGTRYPLCLEGERACPPEDVGGVWGYEEFLAALANRKHPEHKRLLKWIGGKFDPEAFSADEATWAMREGLPDWREME